MTDGEAREMARDLVRGSIIEDAAAQFIAQILEHAYDERIKPLKARVERLEAALRFYARRGVVSPWVDDEINEDGGDIARAALTQKDRTDG